MNHIKLRAVSDADAKFLAFIMNNDTVRNALNELPTKLEDLVDAIKEWGKDNDEEVYIISDGKTPIGWLGIFASKLPQKIFIKIFKIIFFKRIATIPANRGFLCFQQVNFCVSWVQIL